MPEGSQRDRKWAGATLKERRLAHGWSREKMAGKCGVSYRTIERIEKAGGEGLEDYNADETSIVRICDAVGLDPNPLLVAFGHQPTSTTRAAPTPDLVERVSRLEKSMQGLAEQVDELRSGIRSIGGELP